MHLSKHGKLRVEFSAQEAQATLEAIDLHLEGQRDAKNLTAEDPSINSAETLVEVANDIDNNKDLLISVKKKLGGE